EPTTRGDPCHPGGHDARLSLRTRYRSDSRAGTAGPRRREGDPRRRPRGLRVGGRPHRGDRAHRARAPGLEVRRPAEGHDAHLLLPPRRALGDGRPGVPGRGVRRLVDGRRAAALARRGPADRARGWDGRRPL
ncbi:MAG: hypothetical protein AVDCRST_MAG53-1526, partial [uncultured Solirubrobacteraceae bacterium]